MSTQLQRLQEEKGIVLMDLAEPESEMSRLIKKAPARRRTQSKAGKRYRKLLREQGEMRKALKRLEELAQELSRQNRAIIQQLQAGNGGARGISVCRVCGDPRCRYPDRIVVRDEREAVEFSRRARYERAPWEMAGHFV